MMKSAPITDLSEQVPQPPAGSDLSAIDTVALDRSAGGDAASRQRLLGLFARSVDQLLPALDEALAGRECAALARIGHTLKNSARTVGAEALAELSESLESTARCGGWSSVERVADLLRIESDRVLTQIGRRLQ